MLYKLAVLIAAPLAAAQSCGSTGAGTDACACYMSSCQDITSLGTEVTKTTTLGPVTGKLVNGINMFIGIPIAASAAGANRFMPPQAITPWTSAVNTFTEHMCPHGGYPVAGTENCLTLDIYAADGVSNQAVMFWVHGGGFTGENPYFNSFPTGGAGGFANYNYAGLPNNGKTMFVMLHYRLGALGWMAHPGFRGTSFTANGYSGAANPGTGSGNWGMFDAVNGLTWLQSNAATFGGDPTKVSVVGESAGGAHVAVLAASPMTVGLATAFIAESPYITFAPATFSMTAREQMDTLYTSRSGCQNTIAVAAAGSTTATTEAACLRAAGIVLLIGDVAFGQSADLKTAFNTVYGTSGGGASLFLYNSVHCWPVVDGWVLEKPPLESMSLGNNVGATIVSGHNMDEYWTFCGIPTWSCGPKPDIFDEGWPLGIAYVTQTATWPEMSAAIGGAFGGSKIQQVKSGLYYSDIVDQVEMLAIQMGTDAWFGVNVPAFLQAALSAPGRSANTVYTYLYAQDVDGQIGFPLTGACHGCELTFVLGFYTMGYTYLSSMMPASMGLSPVFGSGDLAVGNAMNGYWASIYYTGNPNTVSNGLPTWTALSQSTHDTMVFSGDLTLGAAMNPCSRGTSCRTETTKDWRANIKQFWGSSPADIVNTYMAVPTCTAAPTVFTTHKFGYQIGINCSFLPCCTYTSGRRNLLFGMPSSASTNCDPMC